jgi:hypothetical protein
VAVATSLVQQPKNVLKINLGENGEPYIVFENMRKQASTNINSGRKTKDQIIQAAKSSSDETKLTLTNSYLSEPQSPTMMTYCSQGTGENSKITSNNKNSQCL